MIKIGVVAILNLLFQQSAYAHARWIIPSHNTLSGDKPQTITVDMSISNELFKPDHAFKPNTGAALKRPGPPPADLQAITPDQQWLKNIPFNDFTRKSVGSITLDQSGTYRILLQQQAIQFMQFIKENGDKGRAFGSREQADVPTGASNIKQVTMISTIDSFVSRNTFTPVQPLDQGLAIQPITHPNELFAGETARFSLLLNGQPLLTPISLQVVAGQTRYRNDRQVIKLKSNNKGEFNVTWPHAGLYLIEAETNIKTQGSDITKYALYTTLEVNPE